MFAWRERNPLTREDSGVETAEPSIENNTEGDTVQRARSGQCDCFF